MTKILYVDDSVFAQELLSRFLTQEGFEVFTASTSTETFHLVKDAVPQIIITDFNMPAMDGLTLIEEFKKIPSLGDAIFFVLTNEMWKELKSRGQALGVKAWLPKPIDKDVLLASIKKVLAKKTA